MISRPVFYMAHPVSPVGSYPEWSRSWRGAIMQNVRNAKNWLSWLQENDRTRVYIAPWICEVEAFVNKRINTTYEQALQDDEEVVERCNGITLTGGKISSGMQRELNRTKLNNGMVIDLSIFRSAPSRSEWKPSYKLGQVISQLLQGGVKYDQAK